MKTVPFWSDNTPRPANMPLSPLPDQVDLAVIGSGYTGLNAAIVVAKAGGSVAVLEEHTIGWGASSRNGGMYTPGLKPSEATLKKRYGLEHARKFWQWSVDACDHITNMVKQEQIECDYDPRGYVYVAHKPEHITYLETFKQVMENDYGYHGTYLVGKDELHTQIGSPAFYAGLVDEQHSGGVDPAKFVYGLGFAAARHGTTLVENARVTKIQKDGAGYLLTTAQGQLRAKRVLVATNGYSTGLVPRVRRGVFPVGSYIVVTEPLPKEVQDEISPKGRQFYDSKIFLNYFRLTADGRALMGGRNDLSTDLDLHESAKRLTERMLEIWPQVAGYEITHTWTGKLGISFDLMPHIGRVGELWYANGYSGHGLSIGSLLGYEVGQMLAGERSSSMFMDIKQPRYFFTAWDKLYIPFVAQYHRVLDNRR